ncbi:hypothetical protein [Alicyclobacillus sp. SO9]|uniref:hypothetical protein n=1 Tax=Alicyclobacillus sp. SO9 TaxID=2665646 RepID=UPI0018E8B5EF|nr:hypothetical protein [Alicyclobacillus sp. SO9]QQE77409.1 hypothetical protein GI364_15800 [Alicyclobacillus sp. SO9]
MGEWTWLHSLFPLADIAFTKSPIQTEDANVLVRVVRRVEDEAEELYQIRVAPHNVAPFRGGPWLHTFAKTELEQPGKEFEDFCIALAGELHRVKNL